jgi:preprotein translocase subunit SecA
MASANLYMQTDNFVKSLKENAGYLYDEKTKSVTLDDDGVTRAEKAFGVDNLYDLNNTNLVHFINQALKANYGMKKDFDYVVEDGKIVIVDSFTGRLMHGRAYSDGLHQAIEAKEGVEIQEETKTLATITFQNLFRMYEKLSGMTGTAKTEEEEFREIYNMYVITIPTNREIARIDYGDLIYSTQAGKFKAIVKEIKARHAEGQPVLVGTVAVETSELLSSMLKKEKIPHEVLNAKNHARESELILNAGQKGAVTIATNMAGRGADIKLGEGVKELGGLAVLGTERHESRRIDNQLRGRSGRQGDPGFSQFYVSFEDDLMVRFGTDRAKGLLQSLGFSDDVAIRHKMLSSTIEQAQKRVEGSNYDIRKTLLQYDDVINQQRELMYERRNKVLDQESIHDIILESIDNYIYDLVFSHINTENVLDELAMNEILEYVNSNLLRKKISIGQIIELTPEEIVQYLVKCITEEYAHKLEEIPVELQNEFEKAVTLRVIDTYWMEHINTMSVLREGIHLRGYANENPLRSYTNEGFQLFEDLLINIDKQTTLFLIRAEIRQNVERKQVAKAQITNDSDKGSKRQPKKVQKVGRNEACPCGSGKKYKQCCGK